jgi:hypothetical protein
MRCNNLILLLNDHTSTLNEKIKFQFFNFQATKIRSMLNLCLQKNKNKYVHLAVEYNQS